MQIYFVRHGESEANLLREFSNGLNKHGLTEKGRAQALALAQTLRGKPITRIYTSPILRALQTAEILARELRLPLEIANALSEYSVGVLEGRSDPESHDLFWQETEAWLKRGELNRRIPQGESFLDIRARFLPFVQTLQEEQAGDALLVGHGGTSRCMLPLALNNISFAFALEHGMANTAAVIAESTPRGLVCRDWCGLGLDGADSAPSSDGALVERVLRFNDALNAQDVDGMMGWMTVDCIFENTAPFPDGTRYSGQAAVRRFWEDFFHESSQPRIAVETIFAAGERCTMTWTYSWLDAQGQPGHIRGVDVYRFTDGLIAEKLSYVKG
jgi:broad specificity phosphatase PhoE